MVGLYFCFIAMTNMELDDYFEVGYIIKTHGLKGEVGVHLDVANPQDYADVDGFLLPINGELIPYFIERIRINGDKAIVKFEGIDRIEEAQPLVKKTIYMPEDQLDELEEDEFYYHDIIGHNVVDEKLGTLGIVSTVYTQAHQDLLSMTYKEKEVLIPISPEHVHKADHSKKELYVSLPDGLLEIYLA